MINFNLLREVYVYVNELWRILARTSPNKNWLCKILSIFQVGTDQAIV